MKVMAIAAAKSALTPEQLKEHMPNEVPATPGRVDSVSDATRWDHV
jgi:hypothetical protein